ncbi:FtsX-like permease family protein [Actinoplanes sp. N902-109]|uniref:FtsX-like permease family protein n=1 Tax=Actinoplanes sp. (strain N902-109) TaxID=649831 RepID=UPI0003293A13|nr:ABC transporter permease [Actinoplanes sp. N902-109]AGL16651.1 ABC transporter integral membrane protein [Actinoplanes sp. N902-109]
MWRAVLANVRANWVRLLLTFTTVLIGATFVSSSVIFAESLARGRAALPADLGVLVTPPDQDPRSGATLDEATRLRLAELPGVTGAAGVVEGYAAAVGTDGKVALPRGFDVKMTGTNWGGTDRLRLDAGRAPTGGTEVALASRVADAGGVDLGDTVQVLYANGSVRAVVTGLYTYTGTGRESGAAPGVAFDTATAQRLLLAPGRYDAVELAVRGDPRQVAEAAAAVLPKGFTAVDRAQLDHELAEEERTLTASVQGTALTFAVISLIVGSTLITNTFAMLVARRSRELALLRAVGATRRQTRRWVLAEAAIIGIAGSVAGFVAGLGLAFPASAYAASFDPTLDGSVTVSWPAPVLTIAAGVLVTILSAWLPARRTARIPPAAALRVAPAEAAHTSRWRRRLGRLLFVPAVLALLGGSAGNNDGFGFLGMLGAVLLLPAVLLLVPAISGPAVRLLHRPTRRRASLSLAVQNIRRFPRRTSATASALLLGVALTTGIGIFASSITDQALVDMTGVLGDDIVIENVSGGPVGAASVSRVAAVSGVGATTTLRDADIAVDGEPARVSSVDPAAIGVTLHLDLGGAQPEQLIDGAFITKETADDRGWKTGQELAVATPDGGTQPVRIAAVLADAPLLGDVLMGPQLAERFLPADSERNALLVAVAAGSDRGAVQNAVRSAVADRPDLRLVTPEGYVRGLITEVDAFLGVAGGLLGLSLLIAFLGIINTLTLSVTERLREIGLLRAVGMSRGQVRAMVCAESLILAALGGLLGLITGGIFGAMAQHLVLTRPVFDLTIPVNSVVLSLAGLVAGGLIAALWPAQRAARANILEAVAPE